MLAENKSFISHWQNGVYSVRLALKKGRAKKKKKKNRQRASVVITFFSPEDDNRAIDLGLGWSRKRSNGTMLSYMIKKNRKLLTMREMPTFWTLRKPLSSAPRFAQFVQKHTFQMCVPNATSLPLNKNHRCLRRWAEYYLCFTTGPVCFRKKSGYGIWMSSEKFLHQKSFLKEVRECRSALGVCRA